MTNVGSRPRARRTRPKRGGRGVTRPAWLSRGGFRPLQKVSTNPYFIHTTFPPLFAFSALGVQGRAEGTRVDSDGSSTRASRPAAAAGLESLSSAVESPPGSGGGGSSGLAAHKPDGPSVVRECARPHPHGPSRSSASLVDHRDGHLHCARLESRLTGGSVHAEPVRRSWRWPWPQRAQTLTTALTARRRAACRGHVTPWLAHLWRGSVLLAKFVGG